MPLVGRFALRVGGNPNSLDCWGPVINLNRDPRWGRNGEGGLEDAYAMGELARAWTSGFQSPRPARGASGGTLLQGVTIFTFDKDGTFRKSECER